MGSTEHPEDCLEWLEREEEHYGYAEFSDAMEEIDKARALFYEELGYELKDEQYAVLKAAQIIRYEELPLASVTYERMEYPGGLQDFYRDIASGQRVAREDVFSLLNTIFGR